MLAARNIHKSFGKRKVLNGLDLCLREGSVFGLVGINGSGKSTLLRILSGVFSPDEGKVVLDDEDIRLEPTRNKERIFFLSDDPYFERQWKIEDLLNFYSCFYPGFSRKSFRSIVERLRLQTDGKIRNFSKGMKRQLYIAIAFSSGCSTLLLDEVFDGLDPLARLTLKRLLIEKVSEEGISCLLTSHSLRELEDIADVFAILDQGRLIDYGRLEDCEESIVKFQMAFANPMDHHAFSKLNVLLLKTNGRVVEIVVKGDKCRTEKELRKLNPLMIEEIPITLEELFIAEVTQKGYQDDPKEIL